MRLYSIPSPLLCLVASLLCRSASAAIIPSLFFDQGLPNLEDRQDLSKRGCDNPCGENGWLCCPSDATCYTNYATQAECSYGPATTHAPQANAGSWVTYTTVFLSTNLEQVTVVTSSFRAAQATVTATVTCSPSLQETPCGNQCCKAGQYCAAGNLCMDTGGGGSSNYYSSLATVTSYVTNSVTAPARVTSVSTAVLTSTTSTASTVPYETPATTIGVVSGAQATSHGLSGGAIAGIVIGVIAAIIILLLLCLCCCAKELVEGFLGLFGLGRRRRVRETEVIEERRSHRDSRGGRRTWFGAGPARPARSRVSAKEKKSGGLGGMLGVAGLLGGLAVILGLKRKRDRRDEKSSVSSDYYSYDSYTGTSPSELNGSPVLSIC